MKHRLFLVLFCLATSMITLGCCGVYYKVKSYDTNSKMFAEGVKEGLKFKECDK